VTDSSDTAVSPDFVSWMASEVERWADHYGGVTKRRAFQAWVLHFLFDVEDDDAFNQSDTLSQGDAGLDGWYFNGEANVFHLVQAKYLDDPINGLVAPGDLDPLFKAALLLRTPQNVEDGPHRDKLTAVALALEQALLDEVPVSLDFVVAGRLSDTAEQHLQQAAVNLLGNYTAEIYDTERLYQQKLSDDPIEDLEGQQVRFLLARPNEYFERAAALGIPGVDKVAVAAFDGRSLADAVEQWGPRLFHANVRYYLRRANQVNKKMLETLNGEEGRKAFWLYNNGLTIVADSFTFETGQDQKFLVATNPQIVNGAQTSSVLRERRAHLAPGDVAVQARVIAVTESENGRKELERISESTNNQTPVRASDLRANDRRHRTLQAHFEMLDPPVFYERRRGEWWALNAATRAAYGSRHVTKEDIGQRYLAYRGMPASAVSSKDDMFRPNALESEAFDPSVPAQVYMLADSLYQQADQLLSASSSERLIALVPGFAQPIGTQADAPTQLAVLLRARKLACAHATALAREVLVWRYAEVGPQRAEVLRVLLADEDGDAYRFLWSYAFRTIRLWFVGQADKAAVHKVLRRSESLTDMVSTLKDTLVDASKDRLPPL
jgi:hypothetical protein